MKPASPRRRRLHHHRGQPAVGDRQAGAARVLRPVRCGHREQVHPRGGGAAHRRTGRRPGDRRGLGSHQGAHRAQAAYYRGSGAFTRQGRGDTATHKLFVERAYALLQPGGRLAYVIPSGIYTDLGTKELREMLFNEGRDRVPLQLQQRALLLPGGGSSLQVHAAWARRRVDTSDGFWATFRFNPRVAVGPRINFRPSWNRQHSHPHRTRVSQESFSPVKFEGQRSRFADGLSGGRPLSASRLSWVGNWLTHGRPS